MKNLYVVEVADFKRSNGDVILSEYLFASFDEQEARNYFFNVALPEEQNLASYLTKSENEERRRELLLNVFTTKNDELLLDDIVTKKGNLIEIDCYDGVEPFGCIECIELNAPQVDEEDEDDDVLEDDGEPFEQKSLWYEIRAAIGDNVIKTESDIGSVLVGNKDMTMTISNGYGDGTTRIGVFEKENEITNKMRFVCQVNGTFNVYDYDCYQTAEQLNSPRNIATTLSGHYYVYCYEGIVVFEKRW
ncbi:MAG: hypothetical protein SO434_04950 [Eubacteriales bacterium]|nr:hypothetical protein [Eubacteriales bacterium]